jgi:hypothetical protein
MVSVKGNQARSPVRRYFFIGTKPPYPAEAAGAAGAGAAGVDVLSLDLALSAALGAESIPVGVLEVAAGPPLKSVAYQPEPLSWKPAAVSCFLKVEAPQDGQSVSRESDIFCKTSLANPQDSHL